MPELKDSVNILSHNDSIVVEPIIKANYPGGLSDTVVTRAACKHQLTQYPAVTLVEGREPEGYYVSPIKSTGTLLMLVTAFLIVAFCYRNGRKYFATMVTNTWAVRRTKNHLDDHTSSETLAMIALIVQAVIMEGLMAFSACKGFEIEIPNVRNSVLLFVALAGAFYVAQLLLFRLIGFVFAGNNETNIWIQGFNASQSLMGLMISPIAVITLFFPIYTKNMLILALIIYTTARIAFLIKGFRVFYTNIFQCFYFILYLCAVELVPYVLMYKALL